MTTLNRSVKEHLRRLVRDERARTSRVLVRLRAGAAGLYLLAVWYFSTVEHLTDWQATLPFFSLYTLLGLFLLALTVKWPQLLPSAGLAVGLLDVPAMTMVSLSSITSMEQPIYLLLG